MSEDQEIEQLSVVEAVEALSSLADLEMEAPLGVTKGNRLVIGGEAANYRSVHWLHEGNRRMALEAVRETFKVVLEYLKSFYEAQGTLSDKKDIEGIRTIMVLVGEASEKLDRFTSLFRRQDLPSVTELPEYLDLQSFYKENFLTQVEGDPRFKDLFSDAVGVPDKPKRRTYVGKKQIKDGRRVFVDLDSVKRDTEYELLFLRKLGGQRFYSQDLVRNLRLICDFGRTFGKRQEEDPLLRTRYWLDKLLHITAVDLVVRVGTRIDEFYRESLTASANPVVQLLNKALMALFLSANPRNLMRNSPAKTCTGYFADFQVYLREALNSHDYRTIVTRGVQDRHHWKSVVAETLQDLGYALFALGRGHLTLQPIVELIAGESDGGSLTQDLDRRWKRMIEVVKEHPSGPLLKVLEGLTQGQMRSFDNYMHLNLPGRLFELFHGSTRVIITRLPAPVWQETIQEAHIIPEFKGFLRGGLSKRVPRRHLLINLQDSTSWKEHARCKAIMEVGLHEDLESGIDVVSLNKNSDFYHQLGPYAEIGKAKEFIVTFIEQLRDEGTGFQFPSKVHKQILGSFLEKLMQGIHIAFFDERNVLTRTERRDFIELAYHFILIKLIEEIEPDSCSLTCKDTFDVGAGSVASLIGISSLMSEKPWGEKEANFLATLLFAPTLMLRERMVHPARFEHAFGVIRRVEERMGELGKKGFEKVVKSNFGSLFNVLPTKSHVEIPESPEETHTTE